MTGYAAPDIYHRLHGGLGSNNWSETGNFTGEQQQLQDSINVQVTQLNSQMNGAWQGDAATQAVSGAMPLATATQEAGTSLGQAQSAISSQVNAFHTAYNSVVPMANSAPPNNALNQVETFFGANTDLDKQIAQYQADGSHNVQVYNSYSSASSENAAAMPTDYGTLPDAHPDVSVTAAGVSAGGGGGYGGSAGPTGGYGGSAASDYAGSPGGGYSGFGNTPSAGSSGPGGGMFAPGGSGGSTNPADFTGSSGDGPTTLPLEEGPGFAPGGLPFGAGNPNNSEDTPIGATPFGPGGLNSLTGLPGEGGFGGSGGAGGAGGSGGAGAGGVGSESAANQSARSGVGTGNATGANAAAAEEAMARTGMAGEPGVGMAGRGRGAKGEEDAEHKTAEYLQEPDPDAVFGTDQMTVPPVIG